MPVSGVQRHVNWLQSKFLVLLCVMRIYDALGGCPCLGCMRCVQALSVFCGRAFCQCAYRHSCSCGRKDRDLLLDAVRFDCMLEVTSLLAFRRRPQHQNDVTRAAACKEHIRDVLGRLLKV